MKLSERFFFPSLFLVVVFFFSSHYAEAATLSFISDTITDSAPSATTSHMVRFTTPTGIPAGGMIIITPEQLGGNNFLFPATLDYTDVDFSVASSGPLLPRTLLGAPTATDDGVSVVSGTSGSLTITLASDPFLAIPAGSSIVIAVGSIATVGAVGDEWIVSPPSVGSYRIHFATRDSGGVAIDRGETLVALVQPVTLGPANTTNPIPPTRSNPLPSGLLPGSTSNVLISLNTDVLATCRYATTSGVSYTAMSVANKFTSVNLGLLHYLSIPGTENTVYNFYVRCANSSNTANTDDLLISYEIGVIPNTGETTPPPPAGPSGSGGNYVSGGEVTLTGQGLPLGNLVYLKDGIPVRDEVMSQLGGFSTTFSSLSRGTYTWGVYVRDPLGRRSAVYNSTIYLIGGTTNIIAPIYLSPTIGAKSITTPLGENIVLSGFAIPLKPVQVIMNKQNEALTGKIVTGTTTANGNGSWQVTLSSAGLTKGTYEVKAQSLISQREQSNLSPTLYLGLGEDPNPNLFNRSDLNRDGKVNLIDFSILLFNWKTNDAIADINQDGTVNLTDFSIMLSNWTG